MERRCARRVRWSRQYAHRIAQLLESDSALVGEPGSSYEGKLIFPWGYGDMFTVTFKCLLTLPQVDRVRWHLFPEIRVSQGIFVETVPDIVRVMDLQQEQLARSMGEGHRVIQDPSRIREARRMQAHDSAARVGRTMV